MSWASWLLVVLFVWAECLDCPGLGPLVRWWYARRDRDGRLRVRWCRRGWRIVRCGVRR